VILAAVKEVAGPTFFALLVIAVAFCLCWSWKARKENFSGAGLCQELFHGGGRGACHYINSRAQAASRAPPNDSGIIGRLDSSPPQFPAGRPNSFPGRPPITGPLMRFYEPIVRWTLRWKWQVIAGRSRWFF